MERGRLERVGVPPWELPHLFRLILFVEGAHDEWVIDELVGSELSDLRVKVLATRGAHRMPGLMAADADFLFAHTTAQVAFVVDNARAAILRAALERARAATTVQEAREEIENTFPNRPSSEEAVVRTVLTRAVETDRLPRVADLFGLDKPDILDYLPSESFVPGSTWRELRDEHAIARSTHKGTAKDFKQWLGLEYDVAFDEHAVRRAVQQMDSIPPEITDIVQRCEERTEESLR